MSATSRQDLSKKGRDEALKMLAKYPDRLPVICLKAAEARAGELAGLPERKKFLVPNSMTVNGLRDTIWSHIKDTIQIVVDVQLIKLTASGTLLGNETLQDTYDQHRADDFFLYIHFSIGSSDDRCGASSPVAAAPCEGQSPTTEQRPSNDVSKPTKEPSKEARKLLAKHPNNVPIICTKATGSDAPDIQKNKFLVPCGMTCHEFETVVLDNIKKCIATPLAAITLAVNDEVLEGETSMQMIYENCKSSDGFLYLVYDSKKMPPPPAEPPLAEASTPTPMLPSTDSEKLDVGAHTVESTSSHKVQASELIQQVENTGSQEDDDKEPPLLHGAPPAETEGTQGSSGLEQSSSGTMSVHLPDNDPDVADDLCAPALASPSGNAGASVNLDSSREARADNPPDLPTPLFSCHSGVRNTSTPSSGSPFVAPERQASAASAETSRLLEKHPGRVQVLCTKGRPDVPDIGRTKFLVPGTMLCSEFKYLIHRQLRDTTGGDIGIYETIYLFLDNVSPKTGMTMSELHARYKKEDNYLHITYSLENTLGRIR